MNFLFPNFLYALFLLSVPVIIHLFNFRKYRKQYFPSISFLREINQQTKQQSKLKHILILCSRILALTALILAFAQPYIPFENKIVSGLKKHVSLFIDNSFSMEASFNSGTLLQEAQKKAEEIKDAYLPGDEFNLLTNDFEPRHQLNYSKEEIPDLIDDVDLSPSFRDLKAIFSKQLSLLSTLNPDIQKDIYILSDFQKKMFETKGLQSDTFSNIYFVPIQSKKEENIFIDSCWFDSPVRIAGQVDKIWIRVRNNSADEISELPVKLMINGIQKSITSISIPPETFKDHEISFTIKEPGIQQAVINFKDHPVTFDDSFYFSFEILKELKLLVLNQKEENKTFQNLFLNDPYIKLSQVPVTSLNFSELSKFNLIILNQVDQISTGLAQELQKFISSGGSIMTIPSPEAILESYNSFLNSLNIPGYSPLDTSDTRVSNINTYHPVLKNIFDEKDLQKENIDFPIIRARYPIIQTTTSSEEYLLSLRTGGNFLSKFKFNNGAVYLLGSPLDIAFTNFSKHGLFVPVIYQIVLNSQTTGEIYSIVGENKPYPVKRFSVSGDRVFKLKNMKGDFEIIPEIRTTGTQALLFEHGQVKNAGNYLLEFQDSIVMGVSYNFNRKESDLATYNSKEIEDIILSGGFKNFKVLNNIESNLTSSLSTIEYGSRLWRYFIGLALLFFAVEIFLIRFWR